MLEVLTYLDAYDAFILKHATQLSPQELSECLGISCAEVNARYDNLFFVHPSRQTQLDAEYHAHCDELLKHFRPLLGVKGLISKK